MVYYLTVPPVHEDEYVNQIMNVKVTWQEAWTTVSSIVLLLLISPFYEMDAEGNLRQRRCWEQSEADWYAYKRRCRLRRWF